MEALKVQKVVRDSAEMADVKNASVCGPWGSNCQGYRRGECSFELPHELDHLQIWRRGGFKSRWQGREICNYLQDNNQLQRI